MLKGVNKTVVEINNTENDYIEKAILFISPQKQNIGEIMINHNAKKYLNSLSFGKIKTVKPKSFLKKALVFCLNLALGALIALFFMKI